MTRTLSALKVHHLWVALTLGAAFIGPSSTPVGLPDIFWTLLRGSWMTQHGALLDSDPFTGAPHVPPPILNVQWLADLIYHGLDALGGIAMVITGTAIIVVLTYSLVLAAAVTASGHLRLSCIAVWGAYALGASNLSPRPQTLAYPLFAAFLLAIMLVEWRKDTRLLWLLPPLTVVWANVHGSFFTGLVLLACAVVGRFIQTRSVYATRAYVLTLGACLLASMINPYGPRSLVYVATIGSNQVVRDLVTEWAPTTIAWREGILFFGSLLVLGALMLKSRTRLTAVEILTLLVFAYLAWSSVRAIVWWGLVITPTLARLLGGVVPERASEARNVPLLNLLIIAGILSMAIMSLPWNKAAVPILPPDKRGILSDDVPIRVGDYLRAHEPPSTGRMLNDQGWGGYLEWATWPRHQVFLDGRIELHPNQVWFDYLDIVYPTAQWRALLDQYEVSYLVLNKVEEPDLIADLRSDRSWRLDYEDDQAVVVSRVGSFPAP